LPHPRQLAVIVWDPAVNELVMIVAVVPLTVPVPMEAPPS